MIDEIKIKCRKCQRTALADDFVLDHDYKMMICPACVSEKRSAGKKKQTVEKTQLDDSMDLNEAAQVSPVQSIKPLPRPQFSAPAEKKQEYIEISSKANNISAKQAQASSPQRMEPSRQAETPMGSKVKISCSKCNYRFSYDTERRYPSKCPYCGASVVNN